MSTIKILSSLFKNFFFFFWLCWVFLAVRALSSYGERGLFFTVVCGLLIVVASPVAVHGLQDVWAPAVEASGV